MSGAWICRACRPITGARRKPDCLRAPPPYEMKEPETGWTPRNPFDFLRVRLEAEWGPWATWTNEQHREHTRRIYHLIGWGDIALTKTMIGVGRRNVMRSTAQRAG